MTVSRNGISSPETADMQKKVNNVYGKTSDTANYSINPFLTKNGELFNPHLNYQKMLDNPNISNNAKNFITQATGLTPTGENNTSYANYKKTSKILQINQNTMAIFFSTKTNS